MNLEVKVEGLSHVNKEHPAINRVRRPYCFRLGQTYDLSNTES